MDYSRSSVESALYTMRTNQMRSWTYTNNAIYFAWDSIMSYGRWDVPQVMLLLTDGASTRGLELYDYTYNQWNYPAENLLHDFGITSFAIGIGQGTSNTELNRIATDPDNEFVYDLDDYDELNELYMKITNAVCQVGNTGDSDIDMGSVAIPNIDIPDNSNTHSWYGNHGTLTGNSALGNNYNGGATWTTTTSTTTTTTTTTTQSTTTRETAGKDLATTSQDLDLDDLSTDLILLNTVPNKLSGGRETTTVINNNSGGGGQIYVDPGLSNGGTGYTLGNLRGLQGVQVNSAKERTYMSYGDYWMDKLGLTENRPFSYRTINQGYHLRSVPHMVQNLKNVTQYLSAPMWQDEPEGPPL